MKSSAYVNGFLFEEGPVDTARVALLLSKDPIDGEDLPVCGFISALDVGETHLTALQRCVLEIFGITDVLYTHVTKGEGSDYSVEIYAGVVSTEVFDALEMVSAGQFCTLAMDDLDDFIADPKFKNLLREIFASLYKTDGLVH